MEKEGSVAYEGSCFVINWGIGMNGQCQARDYYEAMSEVDRAKTMALFARMAEVGKIYDTTKFNHETKSLYVFKPQPHRFFCFFLRGRRIFIISAYQKQGDKAPLREIRRATNLRMECIERITREEGQHDKKKK
jgi:predicted DNA-binding WGR domain protein